MKDKDKPSKKSLSRRNFISLASAASVGLGAVSLNSTEEEKLAEKVDVKPVIQEWRNKQAGMAYRQLGRTGMMISEVVNGGDPVRTGNTRPTEIAIERGVNYLDMAPAYGNGDCEKAYSTIIDSSSKREKVFMTTKVSGFTAVRDRMYKEIFDGLPSEKQKAIQRRADDIRAERRVEKPGYFLTYWPGQAATNGPSFLSNAMAEQYAHKVDGSKAFTEKIISSVEGSLKRAKTDYFDILMCPHGANCREEVQIPEIYETFKQLKKEGKVRFLGVSTHNDPAGVLKAAHATDELLPG